MGLFDGIRREAVYIAAVARLLRYIRNVKPDSKSTVIDLLERHARERPDAPAVFHRDRVVNWRALDEGANRYAHWAHGQGVSKGDVVALLMANRPEYLMAWLGIVKTGGIAALINTNLTGQPLAHSIGVANPKRIVLGAELADSFATAMDQFEALAPTWATGAKVQGTEDLDAALARMPETGDPALRHDLTCGDKALYIYTSGTTGLPKAANISHMRMLNMMYSFAAGTKARSHDRMYDPLPLYHSAGGVCALGPAFAEGGAIIVREKFSASEFWSDCHRYEATLFQYIGELCRYLLNQPPHPHERDHKLRVAIGNGLRPEIWMPFKTRFAIPHIVEFYGATEGNAGLMSFDGKPGAVGRVPSYMRNVTPIRIVKFDTETEQPVRGLNGFCIECEPGEAGEQIGKIDPNDPRTKFEGYTQSEDTRKKVLRNVFEHGDAWFRTGDLMRKDEHGYIYFVDRIGDTFRWKGENVATSEVTEALSVFPGVREANVYGVKISGAEGRAGMAALVAGPDLDLARLLAHLEANLPLYARPVFLRLQKEIEVTGTFKHRKVDLVKEGFDPAVISEPLHFLDPRTNRYETLDAALYADIVGGKLKL